jgi:hypothetical protein
VFAEFGVFLGGEVVNFEEADCGILTCRFTVLANAINKTNGRTNDNIVDFHLALLYVKQ